MIYNTSSEIEAQRLRDKIERSIAKGANVEVVEKTKKSLQHNNYFHLLCAFFGMETGYTTEESKMIVKEHVCPELFVYMKGGKRFIESFSKISKEQTSYAIEKFKNYASKHAGITLPEATDIAFLKYIQARESDFNHKVYQN